jgi:hypothetical protein
VTGPGEEHAPLHRRRAGCTAYDCVCGWECFDYVAERQAWESFREHVRGETGQNPPSDAGREPSP